MRSASALEAYDCRVGPAVSGQSAKRYKLPLSKEAIALLEQFRPAIYGQAFC